MQQTRIVIDIDQSTPDQPNYSAKFQWRFAFLFWRTKIDSGRYESLPTLLKAIGKGWTIEQKRRSRRLLRRLRRAFGGAS